MPASGDPLDILGIAPAAARIIRYFLVRPEARPHGRQLQRLLGLGGASLQRELGRLVRLRALAEEKQGRRIHYVVTDETPFWRAMGIIESAAEDPAPLLRDALADVPGIEAAFVFGSAAAGQQRDDSDIDVLVVDSAVCDTKMLLRRLAGVGVLLGREVNPVRYSSGSLAERLGDPSHPARAFVRQVLSGPKAWVAGSASSIEPIAVAAGLDRDQLTGKAV
jgi:predicted nucleotidyltransferase